MIKKLKKKTSEEKTAVWIWRLGAVSLTLALLAIFFVRFFVLHRATNHDTNFDIVTLPVFVILTAGFLTMSILMIIFPFNYTLCAIFCWLWGITRLIDGGSVAGLSVYLLGCVFAFRQGMFRKHLKIKTALLIFAAVAAIISQYRYGKTVLVRNLVTYFEFAVVIAAVALLDWPTIQKLREERKSMILQLPISRFSERDAKILRLVLEGQKYSAIAAECSVSENTLKHQLPSLFRKLQVADRNSFVIRYSGYTITLVDNNPKVPPETSGSYTYFAPAQV